MKHNLLESGEESPVFRHGEYVNLGITAIAAAVIWYYYKKKNK